MTWNLNHFRVWFYIIKIQVKEIVYLAELVLLWYVAEVVLLWLLDLKHKKGIFKKYIVILRSSIGSMSGIYLISKLPSKSCNLVSNIAVMVSNQIKTLTMNMTVPAILMPTISDIFWRYNDIRFWFFIDLITAFCKSTSQNWYW